MELLVGPRAHNLEVRGAPSGTTLRASNRFHGRALIRCDSASLIRFSGFAIDGNRTALERPSGLPPFNRSFAEFTAGNGILAVDVTGLSVSGVRFFGVPGFAILASQSRNVSVDRVEVEDSGSRNAEGRNNATGGILLEEGAPKTSASPAVRCVTCAATASGRTRSTLRLATGTGA
jgi:hypothetical protein